MKRLNKIQKEIEGLADRVPGLNESQKAWAIRAFRYSVDIGQFATKARCPNCGQLFDPDDFYSQSMDCPHCGAKLRVRKHYDRFLKSPVKQKFFVTMNVAGEWQVTRLFLMQRTCYVRKQSTPWEFYEVCQAWNRPDLDTTYFRSLPKNGAMCNVFNPYKLMDYEYEYDREKREYVLVSSKPCSLEARLPGGKNYFQTENLAPGSEILQYYKQRGITARAIRSMAGYDCYTALGLFELIAKGGYKPMYETLMKEGEYKIFNRITNRTYMNHAMAYFTAWKICRRNGYDHRRNLEEWLDLVDLLVDCNLDYHNPHYVCPEDLNGMHRRILRMFDRKHEYEKVLSMKEKNDAYKARVARFLNMNIHNETLKLVVLPTIMAFKKEGDGLGHCVYRCKYYERENSLILSARDRKGKRWETVEVSLKDFKVLQCYGYADNFSTRHNEILDLVNGNMDKIRNAARAKVS